MVLQEPDPGSLLLAQAADDVGDSSSLEHLRLLLIWSRAKVEMLSDLVEWIPADADREVQIKAEQCKDTIRQILERRHGCSWAGMRTAAVHFRVQLW